jgi:hypothetical protein
MHLDCPYPSTKAKTELAFLTGKSLQQVNSWFYNTRKRKSPFVEVVQSKKRKLVKAANEYSNK